MKVYLDHGATTPMDPKVLEAMSPYMTERFGNASSLHSYGIEAKEAYEDARESVAGSIGANPKEIIFTSGGTESDNLAIKGFCFMNRKKGNHIITTNIEHPAVRETLAYMEKNGFKITYLPVDEEGIISVEDFRDAITEHTIMATIMLANNEIGTIQPVEEIGSICREKGIILHTDAVQAMGKLPIDVKKMNIDMLSCSGHKVYGPKGTGFLYVRDSIRLYPQMHGGSHEHGMRSGTENVAGAVGLAKALELCKGHKDLTQLRDRLIEGVLKIPDSRLNGHRTKRLSFNANFSFDYIEGESIMLHLDDKGIAVSTGSACASHTLKPSYVLTAIGLRPEEAHGSIRLTLGKDTTEEQIQYTISTLTEVVKKLRALSPIKTKADLHEAERREH